MASTSTSDLMVASIEVGFTLGFGFLTVWEAIKQTKRNHNPTRSVYIYMIWGEIISNTIIGVMAFLLINGVVTPCVPVLLSTLIPWVFEVQLLMQIIINRIAIIAGSRATIKKLKWGTAAFITCINIAVFCIWLPSQTIPPVNDTFVEINKYWDRTSKILIAIVDVSLNIYFIRTVKKHLVDKGLLKYAPLVSFNMGLMLVSISMDILIIGLMSLPNKLVFLQSHPLAYMVKLNIEMTMANLIATLARHSKSDQEYVWSTTSRNEKATRHGEAQIWIGNHALQHVHTSKATQGDVNEDLGDLESQGNCIYKRTNVDLKIEHNPDDHTTTRMTQWDNAEDELPLKHNAGIPKAASYKGTAIAREQSRNSSSASREF